jgi:uncharacterized membrane protein
MLANIAIICAIIAGIYSAYTINHLIFLVQVLSTMIALILLFLAQSA